MRETFLADLRHLKELKEDEVARATEEAVVEDLGFDRDDDDGGDDDGAEILSNLKTKHTMHADYIAIPDIADTPPDGDTIQSFADAMYEVEMLEEITEVEEDSQIKKSASRLWEMPVCSLRVDINGLEATLASYLPVDTAEKIRFDLLSPEGREYPLHGNRGALQGVRLFCNLEINVPWEFIGETVRIAVELAIKGEQHANRYYQAEAEGIDPVLGLGVKCRGKDAERQEIGSVAP